MRQAENSIKPQKYPRLPRPLEAGCDLWIVPNILDFLNLSACGERALNI